MVKAIGNWIVRFNGQNKVLRRSGTVLEGETGTYRWNQFRALVN